jgi:hypothetical protein
MVRGARAQARRDLGIGEALQEEVSYLALTVR